jgi:Cu(I)/Ag(I) efflux system membrane fusion protein
MNELLKQHRSVVIGGGLVLVLAGAALLALDRRSSGRLSRSEPVVRQDLGPPSRGDAHAAHADPRGSAPLPDGYAPVSIERTRLDALQLSTASVRERELTKVVRTVGVVALDETRSAHVHPKVRGWIHAIDVDFVGRAVRAGEPLCSIYSPDVYAAEIELLTILDGPSTLPHREQLLEAARRRLLLWDVPRSEIERLERTHEPSRTFPLLAPRAGVVISKEAIQGRYVEPSLELYTLSDLSRVWVLVDVYEADVPHVRVGDPVRLLIEGEQAPRPARVSFLAPTIDEAARTRKVRLDVDNAGGRLLPGAFAAAEIMLRVGTGLAIPESAVIRTGTRSIVFVAHGDPPDHLEPREVALGPLVGDVYRVDEGLLAGERVATGAQFLLDSESRLRATSAAGSGHAH